MNRFQPWKRDFSIVADCGKNSSSKNDGAAMKITSKGQVTIPQEIRERMGLLPDTEVEFVVRGNVVQIVKARQQALSRGARIVRAMRGTATAGLSTDDIMKLTRG
jgi:AbrB family looped-hinge helix DNA binding protein